MFPFPVPWAEVLYGLFSGLSFNPVASIAVIVLAGVLAGTKDADGRRLAMAYGAAAVGWIVGDGIGALEAVTRVPEEWSAWYPLVWGLVALLAGYVLPVLVGRFVGTRVTHGTGWLSTIAIGIALSVGLGAVGATDLAARFVS